VEKKEPEGIGAGLEEKYPSSSGSSSKAIVREAGERMPFFGFLLLTGRRCSSSGNGESTDERIESECSLENPEGE
jgi:hypothetical protein